MKSSILIFLVMVPVRFLSSIISLSADPSLTFPDLIKWGKSDRTRKFFLKNLFDYINGAAYSNLTYQFRHLWVKEYKKVSGASIKTGIYEHQDEKNAVYTEELY